MLNSLAVTTLTDAEATALAGGIVGGAVVAMGLFALVFYIFMIIAWWKIFEKAGEKGWKAIIPVYNLYISYKIVKMEIWFWVLLAISVIAGIVFSVSGAYDSTGSINPGYNWTANPGVLITAIVTGAVAIWAEVLYAWRLSKAFGHGVGFTIGLIFLSPIFLLILGFGHSKFNKKKLLA